MKSQTWTWSISAAVVSVLVACGGGGGATSPSGTAGPSGSTGSANGAGPNAVSSGEVTAFGSIFVNGHEFTTANVSVVDDDTGVSTSSTSSLEVGQVLDVKAASASSASAPMAQTLHVHPLARGYVDASSSGTGGNTLTVMGQTIELSSSTLFSDHRACVTASSNACTAISGPSGLSLTTGSGSAATAGSYVSVDGYLFNAGSGSVNIVATLVSVHDAPTGSSPYAASFKAEGVVSAMSASSITIGGLSVNLGSATCYASGQSMACASAFSVGQVVSAFAASSPALPATSLNASAALLRARLPVQTPGATVELEGSVSSVTSSPAGFVLRGVSVDATALPAGTALPVVGDIVSVVGTVNTAGTGLTASSLNLLRAAISASYDFEADAGGVVAGASANSYVLTVMGQSVAVNSQTALADRSSGRWMQNDPASNPFNISTFQTYLAASSSQHLIVRTAADGSGNLTATSVTIVPASSHDGVFGVVDATPVPSNSSATGTPSTFSIHGVSVSADPAAVIVLQGRGSTSTGIAAGDLVTALGSDANGMLTVTASPSFSNFVLDLGVPKQRDCMGF